MQIENHIKQFILQNLYFAENNTLGDEDSFLETGVVDSTGVMELVAFVQTEFGVVVGPQDIVVENFDSIRKVAHFVRRKLSVPEQQEPSAAGPLATEPATAAGR
jgi:acyl carrier protein